MSAEVAYVGNRGLGFIGDNPAANYNQPTIVGFGTLSQDQRPSRSSARVRLDAGHRLLQQHRQEPLQLDAGQADASAWSNGFSLLTHYTLQSAKNNDADYFFVDPDVNYGPAELHPQARVRAGRHRTSCPS